MPKECNHGITKPHSEKCMPEENKEEEVAGQGTGEQEASGSEDSAEDEAEVGEDAAEHGEAKTDF